MRARLTGDRHAIGRSAATAKSQTADLFAEEVPAQATLAAVRRVTLSPQPIVEAQSRQLWYAVVFSSVAPQLPRLGLSAQQFTSRVSIDMPNALLLEIKGSVKLFGSPAVLHTSIDSAWDRLSLPSASAAAPTPLAALWFARAGKRVCIEDLGQLSGELAELPISCTSWELERLQTLRAMGVTRLGELMRLPRAGIARRLGPPALLDLDIALGRQAAPRRTFIPRERFRERYDFEAEIETVLYLQKALEPLVGRCADFLRIRQAGVQALELKLRHRSLPPTRVRLGLAGITSEQRRLADVLNEKLNQLELAAPVRGMELLSGALQPLSGDSLDAFAGLHGGRDTAPQLVERLRARLGEEAVYGVAPIAEHRPEAAWQRVRELPLTGSGRSGAVAILCGMPRPVWLLDAPAMLSRSLEPLLHQGLILEQGPERIESGWWDGGDVRRDYYIARQGHGARWWVFQERRTRHWFLHGVFA